MDEDQKATAAQDPLDAAAAEAVSDQIEEQENEEQEQQNQEDKDDQVAEAEKPADELDHEGLPANHGERSNLGRKVTALHRRIDEYDSKFDRILSALESKKEAEENPYEGIDPDEPITVKEAVSLAEKIAEKKYQALEQSRSNQTQEYNDTYTKTIAGLGTDLSQAEYDGVLAEMKNITYDPSSNAEIDAERNFYRAERAWLRKQMAKPVEKKNPIKGKDKPTGTVTSQKSVVREPEKPKLSAAAQSYLEYIKREDGEEAAEKRVKSL